MAFGHLLFVRSVYQLLQVGQPELPFVSASSSLAVVCLTKVCAAVQQQVSCWIENSSVCAVLFDNARHIVGCSLQHPVQPVAVFYQLWHWDMCVYVCVLSRVGVSGLGLDCWAACCCGMGDDGGAGGTPDLSL